MAGRSVYRDVSDGEIDGLSRSFKWIWNDTTMLSFSVMVMINVFVPSG